MSFIVENGKAVLKDGDGALQLVDEAKADAAVTRLGLTPATADDVAADDERKRVASLGPLDQIGEEFKSFGEGVRDTGKAALQGAARPLEAIHKAAVDAGLARELGSPYAGDAGRAYLESMSPSGPEALELARDNPLAAGLGGLATEALLLPGGGGLAGAAARVVGTGVLGASEESFQETGAYQPKLDDALFYGGLQTIFEGAVPAARKLRTLLPQRSLVEASIERGKNRLADVFADPDPITRADTLAAHADDVAAVLDGQTELNAKYLNRETRKFLDTYFGKRMGRDRRRDALGYFSGKVSEEGANYAGDLKREWSDEVYRIGKEDPSPVVKRWALHQMEMIRKLPDDPRAVHRSMLEQQLDGEMGSLGYGEIDDALDESIRDLLSGTDEGAEMLQRYDALAEKGVSGQVLQTLREFGEVTEGKAGAVKDWIAQPENRQALRQAIDAVDGASGLLDMTGVPGAAKTLKAATGAARTLIDHYDELAEAVAGKGIREAATVGAKEAVGARAKKLMAKFAPAAAGAAGFTLAGIPGAAIGYGAASFAAKNPAAVARSAKAARKVLNTRIGGLVSDETAQAAADMIGEQGGRIVAGTVGGHLGAGLGAAMGSVLGPIGGLIGHTVGWGTGWIAGRVGSKYLEEPLKKLGRYALREREQTARAMVTPASVHRPKRALAAHNALDATERHASQAGRVAGAAWHAFSGGTDDHRAAWAASRDAVLQSDEELSESLGEEFADMSAEYPELFEKAVEHAFATREFLRGKMPPTSGASLMNPDGIAPDRHAVRKWALYYATAMAPSTAIEDLRNGRGRLEQVETLKALYPDQYNELRNGVVMAIASGARPSISQRARLSLLFDLGGELDPIFSPTLAQAADRARQARAAKQQQTPAASSVPGARSSQSPAERYASPMRVQEAS
jgi:hypothetical protein